VATPLRLGPEEEQGKSYTPRVRERDDLRPEYDIHSLRVLSCGPGRRQPEEKAQMKTLALEIPERLVEELESLVRAGWFASEEEAIRLALAEFLQRNKFRLQEEHQLEDIRWALGVKDAAR